MLRELTGQRSKIDPDLVRLALATVPDPELGQPLTDLGMVGEISLRRGRATVAIRLTTESCPMTEDIRASVTRAASLVDGVCEVQVEFDTMPSRDRAELAERLRTTTPSVAGGLGNHTNVYLVASGKGGVGKSTVTANLAAALARSGKRVGVLDADVWGYSMPQLFGVRRSPVVLGEMMLPVPAHGVSLMSVGFFVDEEQPVIWRGPMLHKALEQFVNDTYWGHLDTLLVDLPPGTGDATLSLVELLPEAALLAVTTPQRTAQVVASRVARMAAETGVPIAGVVENMSSAVCGSCGDTTPVFGTGGGAVLARECGAPLIGQVPLDIELRVAGDRGVPVVLESPKAASSLELTRIAESLPATRRSILGRSLPLSVI